MARASRALKELGEISFLAELVDLARKGFIRFEQDDAGEIRVVKMEGALRG